MRAWWVVVASVSMSGCVAVVPGYSFLGVGMTQREADRAQDDALTLYLWDEVPDDRLAYNPFAAAGNLLVTLVAAPLLWPLMALIEAPPFDDEDDDDWDYYYKLAPTEKDRQDAIRGRERRAREAEERARREAERLEEETRAPPP